MIIAFMNIHFENFLPAEISADSAGIPAGRILPAEIPAEMPAGQR